MVEVEVEEEVAEVAEVEVGLEVVGGACSVCGVAKYREINSLRSKSANCSNASSMSAPVAWGVLEYNFFKTRWENFK